MSRRNLRLIAICLWRGCVDGSHGTRRRDRIGEADEGQDRTGDVREGHCLPIDHEPALEQSVLGDELLQQVGQCGTGERRPALTPHEPTHAFAFLECFAVVETPREVDALLHRLDGVHQLEPQSGRPGRDAVRNQGLL